MFLKIEMKILSFKDSQYQHNIAVVHKKTQLLQ